jgi:hypothetical protein
MSSVFETIDAEKQLAMDRWVFDHLPLSPEQKAEFIRNLPDIVAVDETKEEEHQNKK